MICSTYDPDCYGCRLRHKGVLVSPAATPTRRNKVPPARANPAWENTTVGEHRPDGSFMPLLSEEGDRVIKVKEYGERRREIQTKRRIAKGS